MQMLRAEIRITEFK